MCRKAKDIMDLKWEYGFAEGDYLYLGEKYGVRVIGFDYFKVSENYDDGKFKEKLELKLVNTDPYNLSSNDGGSGRRTAEVQIDKLDLVIETFVNPIWLPRQDQMESFYYKAVIETVDVHTWIQHLNEYRISLLREDLETFKSGEQIALSFIMEQHFKKYWNKKSERWLKKK